MNRAPKQVSDDFCLKGGLARIGGLAVVVMGTVKGHTPGDMQAANYGESLGRRIRGAIVSVRQVPSKTQVRSRLNMSRGSGRSFKLLQRSKVLWPPPCLPPKYTCACTNASRYSLVASNEYAKDC